MPGGWGTRRADTLSRVRGEVTELKNVMVDNIEKVCGADSKCRQGKLCSEIECTPLPGGAGRPT